jgi:hypothetical protein
MNPVPIDPWAFELPDYLLRASASPDETRAYDAAVRPDAFYQDDRQITAAALALHPLLGDQTVAALLGALSPADPTCTTSRARCFPSWTRARILRSISCSRVGPDSWSRC